MSDPKRDAGREVLRGQKEQFEQACFSRVDELVAEGIYPDWYAAQVRKHAAAKDLGFSMDPKKDGRAFAEVGLKSLREFKQGVERATERVAEIEPVLRGVEEMVAALDPDSRRDPAYKNVLEAAARMRPQLDQLKASMSRAKKVDYFDETGFVPKNDLRVLEADMKTLEKFSEAN